MTNAPVLLSIDDLDIVRGGRTLLSNLSFDVAAGEILWLSGPNGIGKTSLLRAIAGLLPTESGSITAPACHFIASETALKSPLTLEENLIAWRGMLKGVAEPGPAAAALGIADLLFEPVRVFSTGQKRRAALARLLMAARPLWLLDEPLSGLDARARQQLNALLDSHREAGGAAIIASHEPLDAGFRRLDLTPEAPC